MAADEKWYFTKDQIALAPSRKYGYDSDKELSCRQQAANFIQDMGQRLQVTQLCINTAIVYMHRFYMFHSFTRFHRNNMAAAALFLAAKVEEQPRKLEHVIKVSQICLHRDTPPPDVKSEAYMEQAQELVVNENILLQTLGFDVAIDHPHTHVVRCCQLVRAHKDLAQTSYFMASNSLHLTTMCLQYKPTVVACFCIHLACKWSNWEIPESTEGKPWFWYIDKSVSQELLEQLTDEFLAIFEKCPSRLKKKIVSLSQNQNPTILSQFSSNKDDKKRNGEGSSSSGLFPTGTTMSTPEEMKKKQEFQRHHPEYKKHHLSTHHSRPDAPSVGSKSSCMFGPPQRTQPSSHSSVSGSHPSRSIPKPSAPDMNNLGKPEHLHHRPRRPEEKHPSRNHEHSIPPPYKKFENKVPASGMVNEFPQSGPNSRGVNYSNNAPSGYQVAQQVPQVIHPAVSMPEPNMKESLPPVNTVPKLAPPLPPKTIVGKSPPPVFKVERSIFSPEKSTPPTETLIKPLPPTPPPITSYPNPSNYLPKMAVTIKQEEMIIPKIEPMTPIEIKQEASISPKEEKPPDLLSGALLDNPVPVKIEPVPTEIAPSQSHAQLPPPEEHHSYKEAKKHKKEKKKHKEHKEKHKDKHKHKHKNRDPEPIRITIPKDKLTLPAQPEGLKIKIARDKITTPIGEPVESPLKIKISQGKIKESKKRDRSEERSPCLPTKYHRPNGTTNFQVNVELDSLDCTNVKQEFDSLYEELSKHQSHRSDRLFEVDRKAREIRRSAPVSPMHEEESFNKGTPGTLTPFSAASSVCSTPQGVQMYNNVEVHSPPSVQFDDSDLNFSDIPECSPPRVKSKRNDSRREENTFRGKIPLKSKDTPPVEQSPTILGRAYAPKEQSNDASNNNQNDWQGKYTQRSNIIYPGANRGAYRGRGARGGYRGAPRGFHEYPNRPWTPQRPPRPPLNYHQRGSFMPHAPRQRPQRMYYPPQPRHMMPVPHRMSQSDQLLEQQMLHEQQMIQYEHMSHQQHMALPPPMAHYVQQAMFVQYADPCPPAGPPLPDEPPPAIPPPPPPE